MLVVVALLAALLLALGVAWSADDPGDGVVLRNVEVAGRPVEGLDEEGLRGVLVELRAEYRATTVRIETDDGDLEVPGGELGLDLDVPATAQVVLAEGRDGPITTRLAGWASSFIAPRSAPVTVEVDDAALAALLVDRDPTGRVAPTEPGFATVDGELQVRPGVPGEGLAAGPLARAIEAAAADGTAPIVVAAAPAPLPPRFAVADVERLADRARELTAAPLAFQAADTTAEVPGEVLLSWLTSTTTTDGLELTVDRARAVADLEATFPDAGEPATDATFRVVDGAVEVVPEVDGTRCCATAAADAAFDALLARPEGPAPLPLAPRPAARTTEDVEALGVVEPIASFTTYFQPGQSRVVNIHRIADLTRGVLIEPGGELSINGLIGRRTAAKGFVAGGVIQDGVFDESIGGGISQFATALFNAAFFGGLDFGTYQSHSIYIPRYPYGREATLSYPQPDLVIENPSPHGVLVWPTYTASSLTVTLYSSPWATGRQTGQSERPAGNCTRVTTERTRTFVDGRVEVDAVYATYRPEEGVDC